MNDLDRLTDTIREFCEEREWDQFHNPKDLAIGISTEANELLQLFRFKDETESFSLLAVGESRSRIEDELADVFFFILRFAQINNIDLESALLSKLRKNAEKYPVEKFKSSNKKYNE